MPWSGEGYHLYFHGSCRWWGHVSGTRGPYKYLPESVKEFPGPEGLATKMRDAVASATWN